MIRTIDIRLNAAHPELPLPEATTYQNAPSTAFLRGVPKSCGLWQITAVSVAATFPDNSTTTRAAVLSAGDVWVATIPACATSGRTTSGLRILADGTDENGDAVTGYVLGVADLAVATFDIAPAPGETSYALRYFDNVPNPPHKGDVARVADALKYYDGTAWQPFADVPSPSTATPLMDGTASAGASAAYARGDHRHPTDTTRASKADATLTERTGFSEWAVHPSSVVVGGETVPLYGPYWDDSGLAPYTGQGWQVDDPFTDLPQFTGNDNRDATSIAVTLGDGTPYTATRTALSGYQLGSQTAKPLASEAEAEALRTEVMGKYTKPSGGIPATDLAAAVQTSLGKADVAAEQVAPAWVSGTTYAANALVSYNGIVYQNISGVAFVSDIPPSGDTNWGARPAESSLAALRTGKADKAELPYSQSATTLDTTRILLSARSANRYDLSAVTGEVDVTLPTITSGKCADVVATIVTGATVPTLSFPSGLTFIPATADWQTLAASSYNVFSFTSTGAPNEWIVGRITSALPTA